LTARARSVSVGGESGLRLIGWRPYLLTVLAGLALAVCAVDVSAGFSASHVTGGTGVWHALHQAVHDIDAWVSHVGVLDWVLVGLSVFLLAWGWLRAAAFARLGTIQIADLTCDDNTLAPVAAKAVLQQELGQRGLLPPSGVPSGSPSVASIADAISKAPIPQAGWVGALVGLVPWPPSSTDFRINGSLMRLGSGAHARVQFAYELVCLGPQQSVRLGAATGADAQDAIRSASPDLYRLIGEAAPNIYPDWARWCSSAALTTYRAGLDLETTPDGYTQARTRYLEASEEDPDNMLARLRAANCLERMATGATTQSEAPDLDARAEALDLQARALGAYLSIRIRRPDLFEAGFRASVLMSVLASQPGQLLAGNVRLKETLRRFERATSRYVDPCDAPDARPDPVRVTGNMAERLEAAALTESRRARHLLRPLRTVVHGKRFRHRFEPTGRERRQLRKALGISKMAQKARREQRLALERVRAEAKGTPRARARFTEQALATASPHLLSEIRQVWWRVLVNGRYMRGRWHVAGWQAHYNAACFYALLPQARRFSGQSSGTALRHRALKHLERAIDQADGALQCSYVRDEDPDLSVLRELSPQRFATALRRICPDELVIRYKAPGASDAWRLRVWGEATRTAHERSSPLVEPVSCDKGVVTFRVRIFDENRGLSFRARLNGRAAGGDAGWTVTPSTLVTQEICVDLAKRTVRDVQKQRVDAASLAAPVSANGHHGVRGAAR
jgi:hypothetical protein